MKKLYTIIGEAPISCCVITCILHAEFVEVCVLCMRDRCKYRSKDSRLCFCRSKRRRTRARPRHTIYRKSVLSRLISYFSTRFFFFSSCFSSSDLYTEKERTQFPSLLYRRACRLWELIFFLWPFFF